MSVPDFLLFREGNPMTAAYTGEWFQTLDLFGYFEKYHVHENGTIWLTPTKLVPSGRKQKDCDAPELVKVELPEVQVILQAELRLLGDFGDLIVTFVDGKVDLIKSSSKLHTQSGLQRRSKAHSQITSI